jgi:hypothetical protein
LSNINLLGSSIRQHAFDTLLVAISDEGVDIQKTLPLIRFFGQDMARVRMAALDFAGGRYAKTLRRAFMCF